MEKKKTNNNNKKQTRQLSPRERRQVAEKALSHRGTQSGEHDGAERGTSPPEFRSGSAGGRTECTEGGGEEALPGRKVGLRLRLSRPPGPPDLGLPPSGPSGSRAKLGRRGRARTEQDAQPRIGARGRGGRGAMAGSLTSKQPARRGGGPAHPTQGDRGTPRLPAPPPEAQRGCPETPGGERQAAHTSARPPPRPPPPPRPGPRGAPRTKPGAGRGGAGGAGGTETPPPRAQVGTVPGVGAGGGARSPWRRLPRGRGGPVPERRVRLSLWRPRGARGGLRAGPRRGAGERGHGGGARPGAGPGQRDGAGAGGARGGAPGGAGRPGRGGASACSRAGTVAKFSRPEPGGALERRREPGAERSWAANPSQPRLHAHALRGRIPEPPRPRPTPGGRRTLPSARPPPAARGCKVPFAKGARAGRAPNRLSLRAPRASPERAGPVTDPEPGSPDNWPPRAPGSNPGPSFPRGSPPRAGLENK